MSFKTINTYFIEIFIVLILEIKAFMTLAIESLPRLWHTKTITTHGE